jgi:hypothetical protein
MRITDPDATRSGFLHAALKIILVRPTLCVAYAGAVGVAVSSIKDVAREHLDDETASRRLLEAHLKSGQHADFLLASLRPPALRVIKDGHVQERESGWIGDHDAYAEYQQHYLAERWEPSSNFYASRAAEADLNVASRMGSAMYDVVFGAYDLSASGDPNAGRPRGGSHATVGEAVVMVVPRAEDGLFKYSEVSRAEASWRNEPLPPGLGAVPPDWGSAERGAFSYSILVPEQPGVGAIGLYFHEGRLGVLYAPLICDDPERYANTTPARFIEIVRLRHGISLFGIGFVTAD